MNFRVEMRAESGSAVKLLETKDVTEALAAWQKAIMEHSRFKVTLASVPFGAFGDPE